MIIAFSALKLFVGRQEEQLVCKKWMMRCWGGLVLPFWCQLAQVVL